MITLLTCAGFVVLVAVWWGRWHHDLPALAVRYVCIAPFLPLLSLFNHNFNNDEYGTVVRTLPIYAVLVLMSLAVYEWQKKGNVLRIGFEGVCLVLYIVVSLAQAPFSIDPAWAVIAWSFSAPGYLLFLIAGRFVTIEELERQRVRIALTIIGFVGINVSLIGYGLLIGKAVELSQTRNFGSVWAGNTLLAYLMVFGGIAWVASRRSLLLTYGVLGASLLGMLLSLSRTALIVIAAYLAFLSTLSFRRNRRAMIAIGVVVVTLGLAFVLLRERLGLDEQLVGGWLVRFYQGDVVGAINAAWQGRTDEFQEYRDFVGRTSWVFGTGFGTFKSYSIYSDAHNMLLTEAFENSVACAVLAVLSFGLPRALFATLRPTFRPIGVSIIGLVVLGEVSGAMLSYRSWDNYYAVYPGWTLFLMVGMLASAFPLRAPAIEAAEAPVMHADPA